MQPAGHGQNDLNGWKEPGISKINSLMCLAMLKNNHNCLISDQLKLT